jgi:hypothetical protein
MRVSSQDFVDREAQNVRIAQLECLTERLSANVLSIKLGALFPVIKTC